MNQDVLGEVQEVVETGDGPAVTGENRDPAPPVLPPGYVAIARDEYYVNNNRTLFGIASVVLTIGTTLYLSPMRLNPNLIFFVAPIALALSILWPLSINLVSGKRWNWKLLRAPTMVCIFMGAMAFFTFVTLALMNADVPAVQAFAEKDFAQFDDGSGKVTLETLTKAQTVQTDLERNIRDLESLVKVVPTSAAGTAATDALRKVIDAERDSLRPADQMQRINMAQANLCSAGSRMPGDTSLIARKCAVARDELLQFGAKLRTQYPLWFKLFRSIHLDS